MEITVKNSRVEDEALWGSRLSLITPRINDNIYQVQGLEIDEDGLAQCLCGRTHKNWLTMEEVAEDVLDVNNDIFRIEL